MRIKEINHSRMVRSVEYLYQKAETNPDAKIYSLFSNHSSRDEFIASIKRNIEAYKDVKGRDVDINNTIKHCVLAFHPKDAEKLNSCLDELVLDAIDKLAIQSDNMNLTAFVHNDRMHPHVHLIWSRIGNDLSSFDDKKIGWRYNEVAKELDLKYNLTKKIEDKLKVTFRSTELYELSDRTALKTLLKNAAIESNSKAEFINYLKDYGVVRTKSKDGSTIYVLPGRIVFNQDVMPSAFNDINLSQTLKSSKLTKDEMKVRQDLISAIRECTSLEDIREMFPLARLKYYEKDGVIYNLKISMNDVIVSLYDCNIANLQLQENPENINNKKNTYIFNHYKGKDIDNEDRVTNKNKKRAKEIGIKNMSR